MAVTNAWSRRNIFLEIPFSGAPISREIFDFHYENAGFAREALDEKGFPGSDRFRKPGNRIITMNK